MPKDSRVQERLQRDIAVRDRSRVGRDQRRPEARLRCWRMDFNNNRRHEALGMRTLTELYRPDGTFDSANVVDLGIPSVRTVSGSGQQSQVPNHPYELGVVQPSRRDRSPIRSALRGRAGVRSSERQRL